MNDSSTSSEPKARTLFASIYRFATALVLLCSAISADAQQLSRPPSPTPLVEMLSTRTAPPMSRASLNILLVEDNAVNQVLAVRLLEKEGHTVVVARTGREALAAFDNPRRAAFDLILMDIQMPEFDGYEVTAAIRRKEEKSSSHIPILAMTANVMQGAREVCLAAGMDGYVAKPIGVEQLFGEIQRLMNYAVGTAKGTGIGKKLDAA